MKKIKPEDVIFTIEDSYLSVWEKCGYRLSHFTDHWKYNEKKWDQNTKDRNLRELMKIEGFEEWYKQENVEDTVDEVLGLKTSCEDKESLADEENWISCHKKLPSRFQWVIVKDQESEFLAKRCFFKQKWKCPSGLVKYYISSKDLWRPSNA